MTVHNSKSSLTIVVSALIGAFIGAITMALLAKSASQYFVVELKHRLAVEEENYGQHAFEKGDVQGAAHHYRNFISLTAVDRTTAFERIKPEWSLVYPVVGSIVNYLNTSIDPKAVKAREGAARAKLAWVLDTAGQKQEASEQYEKARVLMGFDEIEKTKAFAKELMKGDREQRAK